MTIHAFASWWTLLSWSHAAFIALAVLIVTTLLAYIIGKALTINELPVPRAYPTVDYSAQYEEKREWLGARYLLAKSINRRGVHTAPGRPQ